MTLDPRYKNTKMVTNKDATNHVHLLITMADVSKDHQHVITGATGPAIRSGNSHVHQIYLRTSFDPKEDNSHWHFACDTTGTALDLPDNQHTHFFKGETSCDLGHKHCFSDVTAASPDDDYCETEDDTDDDTDCNYKHHKHYK